MLEPLALTRGFLPVLEKYLGKSVISKLDDAKMDANDPGSLIAAYSFNLSPKEALRHDTHIRKHFNMTFIGRMSLDNILKISSNTDLIISSNIVSLTEVIVILSGNIHQWVDACVNLLKESSSPDLITDMNNVVLTFERSHMREMFKFAHKKYIDEERFILEIK